VERELLNPAGRAHVHDLVTDHPGRYAKGGKRGIKSAMDPVTPPREVEEKRFAHELAELLNVALARGEYERLVLIAPPKFLGILRRSLAPVVRKHLVRAEAKDLTKIKLRDLPEYLESIFQPLAHASATT
jgi:protein required for attachment to host cells